MRIYDFIVPVILFLSLSSLASNFNGIYSYNKGMNKASAIICISQFKEDSAFIFLQAVSGMPDFFSTDLKGFIKIADNKGIYTSRDSCNIEFNFSNKNLVIQQLSACPFAFSSDGKYQKKSVDLKKSNIFLPAFSDKKGFILNDSTNCLNAPHPLAITATQLNKNSEVYITDEFNGYYLIEIKLKKNEFLWVLKKNIRLNKNK